MPYAILRFKKRKAGSIASCEKHNERKKEAYKSNKDIDITKSKDNYYMLQQDGYNYRQCINRLIKEANCKVKKNSTVLVETIITASPEFMNKLSKEEQKQYFQIATEFMISKIGKKNIISAVVHVDEKTPHMHLSFCPITANNRLSAKDILGNQKKLSEWQTEFHEAMSKNWSELERGISSLETKRKHIPTWLFKLGEKLDKQYDEIVKTIQDISVFNAGKNKEKAVKQLKSWVPNVEKFVTEIKQYKSQLANLEEYKQLASFWKSETEHNAGELMSKEATIIELEDEISRLEETIKKIPPEIMQEIQEKGKNKYGRERS